MDRKLSGGDDDRRRRGRDACATPRAGGHARMTVQPRTGSSVGGGVFTSLRYALRRQRNQFVCTFVYVFSSNTFYSNTHTHTSCSVLFCSLAVLGPRVGHTMDVFSPFIPVLCYSDTSAETSAKTPILLKTPSIRTRKSRDKKTSYGRVAGVQNYVWHSNEFFTLRNQPHLRGHKYVIIKQRCTNNRRVNFFSNRIVNL